HLASATLYLSALLLPPSSLSSSSPSLLLSLSFTIPKPTNKANISDNSAQLPQPSQQQPTANAFADAFYAFLAQGLTAFAATQGKQATPIAPSFPTFIVAPSLIPAGMSIPPIFPEIETYILLDIACHKFIPINLCKLDSKYHMKVDISDIDKNAPHAK
ncbi:hypothetical protein H0H87_002025, partial [Tephrocybe sp. NHM501043]